MSQQTPYFLRCKVSDKAKLYDLAMKLGIITWVDFGEGRGEYRPPKSTTSWAEAGVLTEETGETLKDEFGHVMPKLQTRCAPNGEPYWHVNLSMEDDLKALVAAALAKKKDPDLEAALANMGDFFVTDPNTGKPTTPKKPLCVFA